MKPDDKQAIVGLDADGNFYWDGNLVLPIMMEQLRQTCITDPGKRIRIDMDRHTPFGRFVEVMDACQFYNLTNNRNAGRMTRTTTGVSRLTVILSWMIALICFVGGALYIWKMPSLDQER